MLLVPPATRGQQQACSAGAPAASSPMLVHWPHDKLQTDFGGRKEGTPSSLYVGSCGNRARGLLMCVCVGGRLSLGSLRPGRPCSDPALRALCRTTLQVCWPCWTRSVGSPRPRTSPSWRSCARSRATTPSFRSPSSSRTKPSSPSSTMPGRYSLNCLPHGCLCPGGLQQDAQSGNNLGMAEPKESSVNQTPTKSYKGSVQASVRGKIRVLASPIYSIPGGQAVLSYIDFSCYKLNPTGRANQDSDQ